MIIYNILYRIKLLLLCNKLISSCVRNENTFYTFAAICEIRYAIGEAYHNVKNCDNNTILGSDGDWIIRYLKSCDKKLIKIYDTKRV